MTTSSSFTSTVVPSDSLVVTPIWGFRVICGRSRGCAVAGRIAGRCICAGECICAERGAGGPPFLAVFRLPPVEPGDFLGQKNALTYVPSVPEGSGLMPLTLY